ARPRRDLRSFPTRRSSDLGASPRGAERKHVSIRALVYGDADPDSPDAAAVWAQSMTRALAAAGCSTMLLLRSRPATDRLTAALRSEEHTSELQSRENLVCR